MIRETRILEKANKPINSITCGSEPSAKRRTFGSPYLINLEKFSDMTN